jgi:hypothetical protein
LPVTAIPNTSLLLNYNNAGIYDIAVQNAEVTVGSAQASTTQFKWSPASMSFNGSTDYLTIPANAAFALSGNFTIEMWVYPTATIGAFRQLIGTGGSGSTDQLLIGTDPSVTGIFCAGVSSGNSVLPSVGVWTHIAVSRSGTNVYFFLNGVQQGTTKTSSSNALSGTATVGIGYRVAQGDGIFAGYIQDLRITKGIARYTGNFSVPTTTFSVGTATVYVPTIPDAPIIANILLQSSTATNSVSVGYMAPLLNGGSTITSYTAVATPGGFTGTSYTANSGNITINGLAYSNTYTFSVYATNSVGTSTYSAASKSITTPNVLLGRTFILSDMDLAMTDLVLLNTSLSTGIGITKAKSYALATIYGSD